MPASTFPEKPSFELFLEFIKSLNVDFPYPVDQYMGFTSFDSLTYARIATDIYRNRLTYPSQKDFTRYHVYKKGSVVASNLSTEDVKKYNTSEFIIEKDEDTVGFKAAVAMYHKAFSLLDQWFVYSIKATNGVVDHPKADKAYSLAYEHGHSSGFSEIASYFDEFVELIKD